MRLLECVAAFKEELCQAQAQNKNEGMKQLVPVTYIRVKRVHRCSKMRDKLVQSTQVGSYSGS
jgi:hypothetical protein